jgi:RNA polymerase primary sigma factor
MEDIFEYKKDLDKLEIRLLDRDEEKNLALRIKEGDPLALEEFVHCNLPLVISISDRYRARGVSFDELISEGNLALVTATKNFDPSYEVRFSTYGGKCIEESLKRLIYKKDIISIPENNRDEKNKWKKAKLKLEKYSGEEPVPEQVGDELGLDVNRVKNLLDRFESADVLKRGVSSTHYISDLENQSYAVFGAYEEINPLDILISKFASECVKNYVVRYEGNKADVVAFIMRFGLDGNDPCTFNDIRKVQNLSKQGAINRVNKVKEFLNNKMKESGYLSDEEYPLDGKGYNVRSQTLLK